MQFEQHRRFGAIRVSSISITSFLPTTPSGRDKLRRRCGGVGCEALPVELDGDLRRGGRAVLDAAH